MAKILLVDDDEIQRITLAEILRLEGHDIHTANSGEAAMERLSEEPFDILILDLNMPGMGGLDLLRQVISDLPNLCVIILTAYGSMESAIEAIRYQVHDYLLKPVSPEQLLVSIERARPRINGVSESSAVYHSTRIEHLPGGAILTWDRRLIAWQGGSLTLTPTEARFLHILFDHRNETVTHSDLVYLIQGYQIEGEEAAKILRPVVSRLRHKLTVLPGWDDRIKNVRGSGYVLDLS